MSKSKEAKRYRTAGATVFFLGLYDEDNSSVTYAVTARHCINSSYSEFYIQQNEAPDILTRFEDWLFHPETDIAVCRLADELQPPCLKMKMVGQKNSGQLYCGHEVFLVGLFEQLPGRGKIEPIVRFGHIALPETTG